VLRSGTTNRWKFPYNTVADTMSEELEGRQSLRLFCGGGLRHKEAPDPCRAHTPDHQGFDAFEQAASIDYLAHEQLPSRLLNVLLRLYRCG
jgi:hypothetical protein